MDIFFGSGLSRHPPASKGKYEKVTSAAKRRRAARPGPKGLGRAPACARGPPTSEEHGVREQNDVQAGETLLRQEEQLRGEQQESERLLGTRDEGGSPGGSRRGRTAAGARGRPPLTQRRGCARLTWPWLYWVEAHIGWARYQHGRSWSHPAFSICHSGCNKYRKAKRQCGG